MKSHPTNVVSAIAFVAALAINGCTPSDRMASDGVQNSSVSPMPSDMSGNSASDISDDTNIMFVSDDEYFDKLKILEDHYKADRLDQVIIDYKSFGNIRMNEAPSYEMVFFKYVIARRAGNKNDAQNIRYEFENMLDIDSGIAKCSDEIDSITINGKNIKSPMAYERMCGEIELPYYTSHTQEDLKRIERFRRYLKEEG